MAASHWRDQESQSSDLLGLPQVHRVLSTLHSFPEDHHSFSSWHCWSIVGERIIILDSLQYQPWFKAGSLSRLCQQRPGGFLESLAISLCWNPKGSNVSEKCHISGTARLPRGRSGEQNADFFSHVLQSELTPERAT